MDNEIQNTGEVVIYQTEDGKISVDVKLIGETIWLTQAQLCALFEKDKSDISRHLRNIFAEGELDRRATVAKNATVVQRGIRGTVEDEILHYNLDAIISLGYRVKSKRATAFRIWATSVLKEYLIKGYAIQNNLLQQRYEDLKALVEVVGRTMGYLDPPKNDQIAPIFDVVMPDLIGHLLRVIWCYPELLRLRVSISSCIFIVWSGPVAHFLQ